jgi:hypothetical protein
MMRNGSRKVQSDWKREPTWLFGAAVLREHAKLGNCGCHARESCATRAPQWNGRRTSSRHATSTCDQDGNVWLERRERDEARPILVSADDPLERAITLMMAPEGVHRLVVLEDRRLAGIITAMDVLRELAGFGRRNSLRVIAVAPPSDSE